MEKICQMQDDFAAMRIEYDSLVAEKEKWHHESMEMHHMVNQLQFDKEELVRTHTLETGELRKKVSVRSNNFISERIKVNDLRGNPIEMAAQIVWRVVETAQALFDVDDYRQFVRVQVEAAIRTIGSRYPYDDFEHLEVTLRGNHDVVGAELRTELQARLVVAGSP